MGAFKPLLPFGPKTVIETCIAHLRAGGVENVLVVISEGPQAESIKDHLQNAGVTFAVNPEPSSEMSASIVCGVRALPKATEAVVINPVDHAAVPAAVVELLISEWRQSARLVKPTWQGRGGHPVLIDLEFRDELQRLNAPGGLKTFFDLHQSQVQRVPVTCDLIVRDMNTWTDYDALHQDLFGFPPPDLIGKLGSNSETA
ncbi:MAG: molybdenum cofactor cytidylyltransferase [Pyrinomonadaceae bacterium]|jgi:CTP:molybdopterin cytidylyltransferase MocA|nr:molybdenum cofactor cytidylyltransferase [Pyrinomonadaceae bacterium]